MSGLSLSIEVDDAMALAGLSALDAYSRDMTPVMDDIGASMVLSTQQRFETQTAPDGTPWPQSRRALEKGGKTLRDTERLFQSFTHAPAPHDVEWGTNVEYASPHQTGAVITAKDGGYLRFRVGGGFVTVKEVTLPRREFMGVNDDDLSQIGEALLDWFSGAFETGGAQ